MKIAIVWVLCFFLAVASPKAKGTEIEEDWLMSFGALCEGIGIQGAARGYVRIRGATTAEGFEIESISAWIHSAAVQAGSFTVTGYAAILESGEETQKTLLGRPEVATIEPAPGANETSKIYLPRGKTMLAPPRGTVRVHLNGAVKTNSGSCAIGSDSIEINLPRRAGGIQP